MHSDTDVYCYDAARLAGSTILFIFYPFSSACKIVLVVSTSYLQIHLRLRPVSPFSFCVHCCFGPTGVAAAPSKCRLDPGRLILTIANARTCHVLTSHIPFPPQQLSASCWPPSFCFPSSPYPSAHLTWFRRSKARNRTQSSRRSPSYSGTSSFSKLPPSRTSAGKPREFWDRRIVCSASTG